MLLRRIDNPGRLFLRLIEIRSEMAVERTRSSNGCRKQTRFWSQPAPTLRPRQDLATASCVAERLIVSFSISDEEDSPANREVHLQRVRANFERPEPLVDRALLSPALTRSSTLVVGARDVVACLAPYLEESLDSCQRCEDQHDPKHGH